ncbi:hypothetical protein ACMGD3_24305 [Lysinibacillus sphaericus]|uniref:hypothetical protein n=1 Tax=Lysinibacillus sphaericus TaxID=1421 RepID=UPI003F7A4045
MFEIIQEIDPTSINPFRLRINYLGDEEFFKRLINVATEENLYIVLEMDAGVLLRPILSKILRKNLGSRDVSIKRINSFVSSLKKIDIRITKPLAELLKGEVTISFKNNLELIYFEPKIALALNSFINIESKIYNDLVKMKKVCSR